MNRFLVGTILKCLYNFSISIEHNEEKRSCRRKKSFKNDFAIDFLPKLKYDTH